MIVRLGSERNAAYATVEVRMTAPLRVTIGGRSPNSSMRFAAARCARRALPASDSRGLSSPVDRLLGAFAEPAVPSFARLRYNS